MNIIRGNKLQYVPASHEDPQNPGSLKKVLLKKDDIKQGRLQMINWSILPVGKSFEAHFHEDMDEVFIIVNGKAEISIEREREVLEKGDAVIIPAKKVHIMSNISAIDLEYIALGVSSETGGKTVVV
jgi:mannose-6-phosphate isomerase-like protein (cupin superfamily)